MRVVSGEARGRRLLAPPGQSTRPTSDRVREAIFNALGSLGVVEGATVLDLFAGSGALGIEALSRGARSCTFVERDRRALDALRANLAATGMEERSQVIAGDVSAYLARRPEPVDLALVDPPYAFDEWEALLTELRARMVVVESDRVVELPPRWHVVRIRRYGTTVVCFGRAADAE